jgi:hypothetical protein
MCQGISDPLGLVQNSTGKVYLGVGVTMKPSSPNPGPDNNRKSTRLEGVEVISDAMITANLDHLSGVVCGQ